MATPTSITTRLSLAGTALVAAAALAIAPAIAAPTSQTAIDEATLFTAATTTTALTVTSSIALSDAEIADIQYMVEEEKLAHDVYVTLGDLWGTAVFTNISRAETAHMSSVATLIDRYGLEDPIGTNPLGVFTNPTLQSLYDDLVEQGSTSLVDALEVGALIEEVDIADLLESIDETTAPDVAIVWQRLLSGSQNHLTVFTSQLANLGVAYEPTVLDAATYTQMLSEAGQADRGAGFGSAGGNQGGARHGRNS